MPEYFYFISASGYYGEPCTTYGCSLAPPIHSQPFRPAPPGQTPKCARAGSTFCESLDEYPQKQIKFLIENRNIEKFLRDESMENFNSLRQIPDYDDYGYDYPKPKVPSELYPQPVPFIPHAQSATFVYNVPLNVTTNRHVSSTNPFFSQSASISTSYHSFSYQHQGSQRLRPQYHQAPVFFNPNQPNPWPQRNPAEVAGHTRNQNNPLLEFGANPRNRAKRQSDVNGVSICPTKTVSVLPKAAVNNQGNWMYIVNFEDQKKYSQLVRSEICMSDTCDGLCSLPLGYSSKCKQQYVQKRLIALGGSGEDLYNDVFWFPSGCTCQVSLDY
ncbi:protein spaetzle 5 [Copidosoma floridanum]|uniref:protein spaetzle 5 n=1 Tax=Copidosoma floridanum TaxID=29053 RepID=UPI0006C98FE3|nr:protein spaetzle 5 [Copidosoma floridanum]